MMVIEKRRHLRIPAKISVIVVFDDQENIIVEAFDFSCEGIRVQCSTNDRNLITPGGSLIKDGRPIELDLQLHLTDFMRIPVKCHVVFSRRIARDQCQIGLRFVSLDASTYNRLLAFVGSYVDPNVTETADVG